MKKILALVTVLALVAALVVPMAVSANQGTGVNANIAGPTVTLTVPTNNIQLGTLVQGMNPASGYTFTGSWGYVTLVKNSDANGGCLLTASADPNYSTGRLSIKDASGFSIQSPLLVALENVSSTIVAQGSIGSSATVAYNFTTEGTDYFDVGAAVLFTSADWGNGVGSYYSVIDLSVTPAQ